MEGEVAAMEGDVVVAAAAAMEGEEEAATVEGEVVGAAAAEEDAPSAAAVEGEMAAVEGEMAAVEEEIAATAEVLDVAMQPDGADDTKGGEVIEERLMQQFITEELDPVVARGLRMSDSEMGTHFDFDMSMGAPPSCGGAASTDWAPSRDEVAGETRTQTPRDRTITESPDITRDIMERERARLMTSSNPRAQVFAQALEERRRRVTGRDGGQGGVVVGEDAMEVMAAEAEEGMEGGPHAVDEAMEGGEGRNGGSGDTRVEGHETQMDPVVLFSGLDPVEARRS
ncbi:hypothetical protein CBR_g39160 [Chara braunii]|uniref:Uncharacterized protein n=1 Tax=Chara braunii TaxID=69332 RepID=A0A388LRD6_CHABU|nr:hypothetical protein CBR_g39160 [Chara braunii]|eukprot:GBG84783.1 hypothetical protein CBR_g39160 [Chara braunii]